MFTPGLPSAYPGISTKRQHTTNDSAVFYPFVSACGPWADASLNSFSPALWPAAAAGPGSPVQLASPNVPPPLRDEITRQTNSSTTTILARDQASPVQATSPPSPATAPGAALPARDRCVARQATPSAPAPVFLGDSSAGDASGSFINRRFPPSPLHSSTTDADTDPGSPSYPNSRPSPLSNPNFREHLNRPRQPFLQRGLQQTCDSRYCCLHRRCQSGHSLDSNVLTATHVGHYGQYTRAAVAMDSGDPHDIASQQAAAKDYQPAHDSPLVGNKLPCENITNEYAKADPIYVEKTLALPQTYSQYRPVRGDGNCGWRAIGFSYFEKLAESGDQIKLEHEFSRLTAYNQLLETVGDYNYWEDFADPAMELLTELATQASNTGSSVALVHERWNDENATNAIIYYLRLLAATYLKEHAVDYDPFVSDGSGVRGYCETVVQPVNREIEHLGIIALSNVLLKPIGVVLEVAYLDRSPGPTVNQYRFPEEANVQDPAAMGPVIYLLYRPDHYDILYRGPERDSSSNPPEGLVYQVNRVELLPGDLDVGNTPAIGGVSGISEMDFGILSSLMPNYFDVNTGGSMGSPSTNNALPDGFAPQQGQWATGYEEGVTTTSSTLAASSTTAVSTSPSTPLSPGSASTGPAAIQAVARPSSPENCPIRFSNAQYDYDGMPDQYQVQTSTFKNSVYNPAHYRNPNFHPEECHPESEFTDKRTSTRKKKRQDS